METNDNKQTTIRLAVQGLDCPDCAASLERAVQGLPGVLSAQLVFTTSRLSLTAESEEVLPEVVELAGAMGYEVAPEGMPPVPAHQGWWAWVVRRRRELATWVGGGLLLLAFALSLLGLPEVVSNALYAASIVIGGVYVARAGWVGIRTTHAPDMNALMAVAAVGAMIVGEFAEGALTVFLFSLGELLESYSMDRARNAIRTLMNLTPEEATLLSDGEERRVHVTALAPGDRVVVRPGERIPMDGGVLEGSSAVNQAPITGESMPVEKGVGDEVFAGTINGNGVLVMEVTRRADDTTLARILRLVEEAQSQRAMARAWRGHPFVVIPEVATDLSGERVLVTEWVEGRPFEEVTGMEAAERDRFGEIVYRFFAGSLYRNGHFSGDPHPGNYRLLADGRVAFLDFGMTKRVDAGYLAREAAVLDAGMAGDAEALRDALADAGYYAAADERVTAEAVLAHFRDVARWYVDDRPVTIDRELVTTVLIDAGDPRSPHWELMRRGTVPADAMLARRMEGLVLGVLGHLGATANWHRILRELVFGDPPSTPLGELEADHFGERSAAA